jgi:hypothetical protein
MPTGKRSRSKTGFDGGAMPGVQTEQPLFELWFIIKKLLSYL